MILQNGFVMNWATNATTNAVIVRGTLDLTAAASGTIHAAGVLNGNPPAVVLFTQPAGNILGTPGGWTVDKPGYKAVISGNTVMLSFSMKGTSVFFR